MLRRDDSLAPRKRSQARTRCGQARGWGRDRDRVRLGTLERPRDHPPEGRRSVPVTPVATLTRASLPDRRNSLTGGPRRRFIQSLALHLSLVHLLVS